jgi:hypothetical protein
MVKERPLILKAPLVRATLDRRKTETRRVIRTEWSRCLDLDDPDDIEKALQGNPYGQPGDRLWVRETWKYVRTRNHVHCTKIKIRYQADNYELELKLTDREHRDRAIDGMKHGNAWRPSIFMPRIYSRILLAINSVSLQRLHEIAGDGAIAEGVMLQPSASAWSHMGESLRDQYRADAIERFRDLWNTINEGRGYGWDTNPHVFVIDYQVLDANHSC